MKSKAVHKKHIVLVILGIFIVFGLTCLIIVFYRHHSVKSYAQELQQQVSQEFDANMTSEKAMDWLLENDFIHVKRGRYEVRTDESVEEYILVIGTTQIYGKWLFFDNVLFQFVFYFSLDDKFIKTEYKEL